jgi:hypothetical protein
MQPSRQGFSCFLTLAMLLASHALCSSPAIAAGSQKVTICHFPPDDPANFQTITIKAPALAAHLQHGDFLGPCANDCLLFASVCDDNDPCTVDTCKPDGTCAAPLPINCDDGNACTSDSCNPSTGDCVNTPTTGASCNDTNGCTTGNACNATGQCVGTPITGCCAADADCNDNNACTTNTCNLATNTCSSTPRNCNDNDACTADSCLPSDGSCVHAPVSCDDNDCFTQDSCDSVRGCVHTPNPLPSGSYQESCIACEVCGSGPNAILTCACPDSSGSFNLTILFLAECDLSKGIVNTNGELSCTP